MGKKKQKSATAKPDDTFTEPTSGYRVTAKVDGFRRAGIVHAGTVTYGPDELTDEQITAIENEPLLVLESISVAALDNKDSQINPVNPAIPPASPVGDLANIDSSQQQD